MNRKNIWQTPVRSWASQRSQSLNRLRRPRRSSIAILAVSVACAHWAQRANGATESWTDGSANWANAANWNNGAGPVPGGGDTVEISSADGANRTITYNYTGSAITLNSLTIDNDGGGRDTLSMSANTLVSLNDYVGDSGGDGNGIGILTQTGGSSTVNSLYLGYNATDTGTYNLSSTGSLVCHEVETVGDGGTGTFNQSGGTNTTGGLTVGNTGSGTYSLNGTGSLTSEGEAVTATGIFDQTGGTNTMESEGDSLDVRGSYILGGTGSLLLVGNDNVGFAGTGTFIQTGGGQTIGGNGSLMVGGANGGVGTYSLSGTASLSVANNENIGDSLYGGSNTSPGATGVFTQSGGTNHVYNLELAVGSNDQGTYNLQGGALTVPAGQPDSEVIGVSGTATFNQSGGTNAFGPELDVGTGSGGTGSYALSGGSLSGGNIYVGGSSFASGGTGILTVSGTGQLSTTGTLKVYAAGTVNINGGTSTVGGLSIATGGIVNVNGTLFIDYGNGPDPIASIAQWIKNGFYGLPGPAIISSDIAADDAASGLSYGIGYADGADGVVAGLPSGEIEIMFTLLGDANLDGTVNSEDFTPFSTHLGESGMMWDDGDFNYDGTVNAEDFTAFSHNLNQTASLADAGKLESANGISLANVPEPACAGMMVIAGLGILRRRRRAK